jgi:putative hydrolase of the HAD superfamily
MTIKAFLFDLDDTLYSELDFVHGGFRAVADYMARTHNLDRKLVLNNLVKILSEQGRGKIFDLFLNHHDLWTAERVKTMLFIYRTHIPSLTLHVDVQPAFARLRKQGLSLGIITDGLASVQQRKIQALNLPGLVDQIICTDELGPDCGKPSPIAFQLALDLLHVRPEEAVYVGDNPTKDFKGANSLGLFTIRVKRPQGYAVNVPDGISPFAAKMSIQSLSDISQLARFEGVLK